MQEIAPTAQIDQFTPKSASDSAHSALLTKAAKITLSGPGGFIMYVPSTLVDTIQKLFPLSRIGD